MTSWFRQRLTQIRTFILAGALIAALLPAVAHASVYGSGVYGSDVYNGSNSSSSSGSGSSSSGSSSSSGGVDTASASNSNESTVVETPSGMQVAINLANGQVIPSTGYYITITPLNGEGKTFDKAEIYLDGKLVYTGTPDSTGTLKWFWDTLKNPATKVKIIVYGPGAGTTTKEFSVTIGTPDSTGNTNNTSEASSVPDTGSEWPAWLWWLVVFLLLLFILLIWWLVARRRRRDNQSPPPTYTPMQ